MDLADLSDLSPRALIDDFDNDLTPRLRKRSLAGTSIGRLPLRMVTDGSKGLIQAASGQIPSLAIAATSVGCQKRASSNSAGTRTHSVHRLTPAV